MGTAQSRAYRIGAIMAKGEWAPEPMSVLEAKAEAVRLYGPEGSARTMPFVNGRGRTALEKRVGILRNGRYYDFGRGSSFELAFAQATRYIADLRNRRATRAGRTPANDRLQEMVADRNRLRTKHFLGAA